MKLSNLLKHFYLLTIFCAPLYLIKVNIVNLPSNVLELLILLALIFSIAADKKAYLAALTALPKTILLSCALILLGLGLSIFLNPNQFVGLGILKGWFLLPLVFSFVLYKDVASSEDIATVFKAIFFSTALVALIGLAYKALGLVTFDGRLEAFYASPNYLAMYLAPGVFLGIYLLRRSFQQESCSKLFIFYALLFALLLAALFYTYSYGTWLGIFGALLLTLLATIPLKKIFFKGLLLLLFCAAFLFFSQIGTQKFSSSATFAPRSSLSSRLTIWQVSSRLIRENPLAGIGPGNFQSSYLALQKDYPPYLEWAVPQPHNIFLAFWLQTGLIGLIGFVCLLVVLFSTLWQLLHNKKSELLAAPLFAFFLYVVFHGLVDTTYWKNDLAFIFWVCVFLTVLLRKNFSKN